MTSINRVEQTMLLLKEKLRRLQERSASAGKPIAGADRAGRTDGLVPLRELARRGGIDDRELQRALVRSLLTDALGDGLAGSLEFQSISEEVTRILEESESGRALLADALAELRSPAPS